METGLGTCIYIDTVTRSADQLLVVGNLEFGKAREGEGEGEVAGWLCYHCLSLINIDIDRFETRVQQANFNCN